MNDVLARVLEIIESKTKGAAAPDDSFATLAIDSLGMAEIVAEIERKFDVKTDEEILNVNTSRELAAYISELQKQQASKP
jgi:acyl carrier protein